MFKNINRKLASGLIEYLYSKPVNRDKNYVVFGSASEGLSITIFIDDVGVLQDFTCKTNNIKEAFISTQIMSDLIRENASCLSIFCDVSSVKNIFHPFGDEEKNIYKKVLRLIESLEKKYNYTFVDNCLIDWDNSSMEEKYEYVNILIDKKILPIISIDGGSIFLKSINNDIILLQQSSTCLNCNLNTITQNWVINILNKHISSKKIQILFC